MPDIGKHKFYAQLLFWITHASSGFSQHGKSFKSATLFTSSEVHFQPPRAGRNLSCDVPGTDAALSFNH